MAKRHLTEAEAAARKLEYQQVPEFRTEYANNVTVTISPWDFRLTFGTVAEANPEKLAIKNLLEVYISPQHMKAFLGVLQNKVAEYEAAFAAIPDLNKSREA
jgi:hypothetical protein